MDRIDHIIIIFLLLGLIVVLFGVIYLYIIRRDWKKKKAEYEKQLNRYNKF